MQKLLLWSVLFLTLSPCFIQCKKKTEDPGPGSTGTCSIESGYTNGKKESELIYNSQNRITKINDYDTSSGNIIYYLTLQYDGSNRIISDSAYDNSDTLRAFDKYGYNNIGQVISDTSYTIVDVKTKASELVELITYQYNGSQVSRVDTFDYIISSFSLRSYATFSYDGNGNVLKEIDYSSSNSITQTIDYTYDSKKSPLNVISALNPVYLNIKNNTLTETYKDAGGIINNSLSQTISYTYNSEGYAIASTETFLDGRSSSGAVTLHCY